VLVEVDLGGGGVVEFECDSVVSPRIPPALP
jgi:hypothetical protein